LKSYVPKVLILLDGSNIKGQRALSCRCSMGPRGLRILNVLLEGLL
jgi:hypothetical protein